MSALVTSFHPGSPAEKAGVVIGDVLVAVDGEPLRDVIQYQLLTDAASLSIDLERGGMSRTVEVQKSAGEPLGIEVQSAVFDQVRTCDNHCSFCFIYQLPPGMRKSLYLKDDDFRLSFLYGNFTTLTRFTEADLERVITERLSPLYVSIHATEPHARNNMLRNRRGAMSLRWLEALLANDIEVHGQIVVCPGINDGLELDRTLRGVLDRYSTLASLAVVPLGVSQFSNEAEMRPHTQAEAAGVVDLVHSWQEDFLACVGRRLVFAADEYYLLAGRGFPNPDAYEGFDLHEDGIGMARTLEAEFNGTTDGITGTAPGFFAWVDGAPADGYRAPRLSPHAEAGTVTLLPSRKAPIGILTGTYGAQVIGPLVDSVSNVRVLEVKNEFFGGNIGVTGLMVGEDISRVLADEPAGHRYLIPDVCLSNGRFLDGTGPVDLPRPVEIVETNGVALKAAIQSKAAIS